MNYSFTDINAFISDIKDYIHPNLSYYEYQYLLRIFVHKVHDDHTKLNFNDFTCMYAGFTAVFEVNSNIAIFRNKHISTIDKKSNSIKFRATN